MRSARAVSVKLRSGVSGIEIAPPRSASSSSICSRRGPLHQRRKVLLADLTQRACRVLRQLVGELFRESADRLMDRRAAVCGGERHVDRIELAELEDVAGID